MHKFAHQTAVLARTRLSSSPCNSAKGYSATQAQDLPPSDRAVAQTFVRCAAVEPCQTGRQLLSPDGKFPRHPKPPQARVASKCDFFPAGTAHYDQRKQRLRYMV